MPFLPHPAVRFVSFGRKGAVGFAGPKKSKRLWPGKFQSKLPVVLFGYEPSSFIALRVFSRFKDLGYQLLTWFQPKRGQRNPSLSAPRGLPEISKKTNHRNNHKTKTEET